MKNTFKTVITLALVFVLSIALLPAQKAKADEKDMGNADFETPYEGEILSETKAYTFTVPSSGTVGFNLTYGNSSDNWYRFAVYDKVGNELMFERIGNGTFSYSLELLAGDYVLKMWKYVNNDNVPLKYSFVLSFKDAKETVSETYKKRNNEVTTAIAYKTGKETRAQFANNDDTDIYKFEMKKDGFLTLSLDSEVKSMSVEINSSMGDIKYSISGIEIGYHEYKRFCPEGTYYIIFRSENRGIYTFNTSTEKIPAVAVKKVKNTSGMTLTATVGRSEDVNGYEVQVATDKKFTKNTQKQLITSNTQDTTSIYGLTKKSDYYVRVRSYIDASNGKRYYSAWKVWSKKGKAKSITIKK